MAIDSAEKRKSISGIWMGIPGVTPNSAKDSEWRQEAGWSYGGIAVVAISVTKNYGFQAEAIDWEPTIYDVDFEVLFR